MKTINRNAAARLVAAARFNLAEKTDRRDRMSGCFEKLKNRLLQQHLDAAPDATTQTWLRQAAAEAAAFAWATPYPLLLLPALLEEKSGKVLRQAERQRRVQTRSRAILALAA